ncbi:MAG: hypothetical protein EOM25_13060 [Deltaproteobacteria bacterium]|nr:hypothetical protein [Deltaproteobacteria bacterium]
MEDHAGLLAWVGLGSGLLFVATLTLLPWLAARLPQDYLTAEKPLKKKRPWIAWPALIFKNALGLALIALGLAMLVLPGQGLLTVIVGLGLVDFPGRRSLERHCLAHPRVFPALNWLRAQKGRPPLHPPWA